MSRNYNRKDHYYNKAKEDGFASRAAYKLLELDSRFHIFRPGISVLDLGAWPGGWMEIAAEKIGQNGVVVGIDRTPLDHTPSPPIYFIQGEVQDEDSIRQAEDLNRGERFDLVLSDMSPKLTGIREVDQAATVGVAELALWVARHSLATNGNLIIKVFKSQATQEFVKTLNPLFNKVARVELDSTRKTSNEFYVVAQKIKATAQLVR